jgi:dynein heavy chain, axonemal
VAKELERGGESRAIPKRAAQTIVTEIKTFLDEQIPLMLLLCNPGLKERHWQEIMNITGLEIIVHEGSNLSQMIELALHQYTGAIEETCVAANKEYGLEKAMDKMETEWAGMRFETKPHRNTGACALHVTGTPRPGTRAFGLHENGELTNVSWLLCGNSIRHFNPDGH